MFDKTTEALLKEVVLACNNARFYTAFKDICIVAKIALLNIKGGGVKIRPSLLRLSALSDIKTASYVLAELKKVLGAVTDGESLKRVAAELVYKKIAERL
jgi:hypothetical protein